MTNKELQANYHHCVICGIAPCDCGESQETSECAGCFFCDMDDEDEGSEAPHTQEAK